MNIGRSMKDLSDQFMVWAVKHYRSLLGPHGHSTNLIEGTLRSYESEARRRSLEV